MRYRLVDLAGFNPGELRTAGGTWTKQVQQANKAANTPHQRLLKEKAALEAEAKRLRALIAAAHIGKHHGQAGAHKGQPGKHGTSKKGGGKSGHSTAKHPSLAQQVAALKKTVAKLRVEWAKIQRRRRK